MRGDAYRLFCLRVKIDVRGNGFLAVTDFKIMNMKALHSCRNMSIISGLVIVVYILNGCDANKPPPAGAVAIPPQAEPVNRQAESVNQSSESITKLNGEPSPEAPLEVTVKHFPLPGNADYLLVDDFDQDGRLDLALTAHGANLTRLFLQRDARQWNAGPVITSVGFHPGELLRIPWGGEKQQRYLMLAEGNNLLRVMTPTDAGGLTPVAELGATAPRAGAWFHWPGWGLGLVFAPYTKSSLVLVKDFNPTTAVAADALTLNYAPQFAQAEHVAVADLEGDGAEEILFTNSVTRSLMQIRYPGADGQPAIETLWTFQQGGRSRFVFPVDLDQDGDLDLMVPDEIGLPGAKETNINLLIKHVTGGWDSRIISIPARANSRKPRTGIRGAAFGKDQDGHGYLLAAGYDLLTLIRIPPSWTGEKPEMRQIELSTKVALPAAALKDLDGDGWLDAVLAGGMDEAHGGMIIYGPLWEGFAGLRGKDLEVPPPDDTAANKSDVGNSRPAAAENSTMASPD